MERGIAIKQIINYLLTILLWIAGLVLALNSTTPWLLIGLAALHFVELLAIGLRTGRKDGLRPSTTLILSMLFGITWWLPLRKQMQEDDLSAAEILMNLKNYKLIEVG